MCFVALYYNVIIKWCFYYLFNSLHLIQASYFICFIALYYNVITKWCFYYLFNSLQVITSERNLLFHVFCCIVL
jgi:hypothetical protein